MTDTDTTLDTLRDAIRDDDVTAPTTAGPTGTYAELPTTALVSVPNRDLGPLDDLEASIAAVGILQPILVTPHLNNPDLFDVVAGRRRTAAAVNLGLLFVPCVIRTLDEPARVEAALIENLVRRQLSPVEEADAYRTLVDEHHITQAHLAARIGRSEAHISKRLTLLALPDLARQALLDGRLTITTGYELARLAVDPERLNRICDHHLAPVVESSADVTETDGGLAATVTFDPAPPVEDRHLAAEIARELDDLELTRTVARLTAAIVDRGDTLVDWPQWGNWERVQGRKKWRPCRAGETPTGYAVDPRRGREVKLTTEPLPAAKRQTKGKVGYLAARAAAEHAAQEAARTARREVMRTIVAPDLSRAARTRLTEFVHHQVVALIAVGEAGYVTSVEVLELLGDPVPAGTDWRKGDPKLTALLAAGDPEVALRCAAATVLLAAEDGVEGKHWHETAVRNHLALLEREGYELTDHERTGLNPPDPEADPEADE